MDRLLFPEVPDKPRLYDWLYHKTSKDFAMYRRLTEGHERVLECAVGTGRLAIPLAESGKHVFGIDYSEAMLQGLADKLAKQPEEIQQRIRYAQADMRDFDLGEKFSFVFIPFGSFTYLLSIEDQKRCLASLKRHLAPGGTIVIDVPTWEEARDERWLQNDPSLMKVKQAIDPETGKSTEMWSTFRFDSSTQLMEQDRHFRIYDKNGYLESEQAVLWRMRFFLAGELRLLAEVSGLQVTEVYGDFQLGPYHHGSEVVIMVMKAADES